MKIFVSFILGIGVGVMAFWFSESPSNSNKAIMDALGPLSSAIKFYRDERGGQFPADLNDPDFTKTVGELRSQMVIKSKGGNLNWYYLKNRHPRPRALIYPRGADRLEILAVSPPIFRDPASGEPQVVLAVGGGGVNISWTSFLDLVFAADPANSQNQNK